MNREKKGAESKAKKALKIIKATFSGFFADKGMKLSASLSYTTIFAMGPMLLLVMSLASVFFGQDAVEGKIFSQLNGLLGAGAAKQLQEIIRNIQFSGKTNFALITSIVALIIGATSLFAEIQDSVNIIWRVKAKPKRGWLNFLKNRLLSMSLIVSLGFVLIVSLIVNGAIQVLSERLAGYFSHITVLLVAVINFIISLVTTAFVFGIIFKVLPDAKIRWKNVRAGALFTAIFFIAGQFLIGFYLEKVAPGSAYGAAGSIVIILLRVYDASAILYIGAEFTQVYSEAMGNRIEPSAYAVYIEQPEEKKVSVLPQQHSSTLKPGS